MAKFQKTLRPGTPGKRGRPRKKRPGDEVDDTPPPGAYAGAVTGIDGVNELGDILGDGDPDDDDPDDEREPYPDAVTVDEGDGTGDGGGNSGNSGDGASADTLGLYPVTTAAPDMRPGVDAIPSTARRPPIPRLYNGVPAPKYKIMKGLEAAQSWFNLLRPKDWNHLDVYVYQTHPVLMPLDGIKYVEKLNQPEDGDPQSRVDLTRIVNTYGWGKYAITVNDAQARNISHRTIVRFSIDATNLGLPMKFAIERLDRADPKNRSLITQLINEGKLTATGEIKVAEPQHQANDGATARTVEQLTNALLRTVETRGNNQGQNAETHAMSKVVDMMAQAGAKTTEMALAQVKSQDPAAFVSLMVQMQSLMAPKQDNTLVTFMMEQAAESRREAAAARKEAADAQRAHTEMITRMLTEKATTGNPATGPNGMIGMLKELLQVKALLSGDSAAPAAPLSWKEQGMQMLGEHLPDIIQLGTALVTNRGNPQLQPQPQPLTQGVRMTAQGQPRAAGPNPQPFYPVNTDQPRPGQAAMDMDMDTDTDTNPNPNPNPYYDTEDTTLNQPPSPHQPTASDPSPDARTEQRRILGELHNYIDKYGTYFLNAFQADKYGDEFAVSVVTFAGRLAYNQLAAYGGDAWTAAVMTHPQIGPALRGSEQAVHTFWMDFCDCGGTLLEPADDPQSQGENAEQSTPLPDATVKPKKAKKAAIVTPGGAA